jgi:hypothetical protein
MASATVGSHPFQMAMAEQFFMSTILANHSIEASGT